MIRTSAIAMALMCLSPIKAHAEIHVGWKCNGEPSKEICASKGGLEYIYIYGRINEELALAIATIDGLLPLNVKFPIIYLNSGGGQIVSARHIGRILRRRGAEVTTYDPLHPEFVAQCSSACSLIAAGAVTRNLNRVGLHSGSRVERERGKEIRLPLSEEDIALDEAYFEEMGLNPRVMQIVRETSNEKMSVFRYDPEKPLEDQEIFKLGFRMHPAAPDEADRIKRAWKESATDKLIEQYKKGDGSAAHKIAFIFLDKNKDEKELSLGLRYLNKASDLGNHSATHNLAVAYANGRYGLTVDKKKAVSLYLIAAKAGFAPSQNNLGWMYYKGEGTAKNLPEAIYWVTRAAEQGEPFAYGSLGSIRADGNGFKRDYVEAYKWLSLAVQHMPEGKARDSDGAKLKQLMKLMSDKQIRDGEAAVEHWNKTRETVPGMKDKDDV